MTFKTLNGSLFPMSVMQCLLKKMTLTALGKQTTLSAVKLCTVQILSSYAIQRNSNMLKLSKSLTYE